MRNRPLLSIIIVHYHVKKQLLASITSIYQSKTKTPFEIIVIDHDEKPTIQKELQKQFPGVIYSTQSNRGFGAGNNAGVKLAKGDTLFFLNPDTIVLPGAIDALYVFTNKKKNVGMASSLLLDEYRNPYELQGTQRLTPMSAVFGLSFINRWFPDNTVSHSFWQTGWDKHQLKKMDAVPFSAVMIKNDVFAKVGEFDEKYFLYFEEYDFAERLQKLGYENYIVPNSPVVHLWGKSTRQREGIKKTFTQSRNYYFRKYFGLPVALLVNAVLSVNTTTVLFLGLFSWSAFFVLNNIRQLMPFIGDQGWFYLYARNIDLHKAFPLLGIASSHPWLHQGPWWTYLLAIWLPLFHFDPVSGVYLSLLFHFATLIILYITVREMFSRKAAFVTTFLYATSPLIIALSRMPYHTTPIQFFTILYIFSLFKWVTGNTKFFPIIWLSLGFLYNFELATASLGLLILGLFVFGFIKKRLWVTSLKKWKIIVSSLISFLVPMLPMFVSDMSHKFVQTGGFVLWVCYRVAVLFGFPQLHPVQPSANVSLSDFLLTSLQRLVFLPNVWIALALLAGSVLVSMYLFQKNNYNRLSLGLLYFWIIISLFVLVVGKTASQAYVFPLVPAMIIVLGIAIAAIMFNRRITILVTFVVGILCISNIYGLFTQNYLMGKNGFGPVLSERLSAVQTIIQEAGNKPYQLVGKGPGSQFPSFTMNYQYLLWWQGSTPTDHAPQIFTISENGEQVHVEHSVMKASRKP